MKLNNKLLSNATWLIACRLVQAILSFAVGIVSARYLGPSNYGIINYAESIVTFLIPIVQLGIRNILVQEIVNHPSEDGKILGTTLVITVINSILGIVFVYCFVTIVNEKKPEMILVCVLYSTSMIFQSLEMIQYWFQAKLMSKYIAITSLVAYVVISFYRIILLILRKSVYWFAIAHAMDYLIIAGILLVIYSKISQHRLTVSLYTARRLLSKSRYYIVSGIMVSFFSQVDRIMLTVMKGENTNGIYSAALTCCNISNFVFAAIIDSFRPVIFESKKVDQKEFEKNISLLYSIIISFAILQSIVIIIFARLIILLLYGTDYINSITVLRILAWYPLFSYMGSVRNIWILGEGKQHVMWIINSLGVILNIIGNYLLIPIWGTNGAAFASVITQLFTNYILSFILPSLRKNNKLLHNGLNGKNLIKFFDKLVKYRGN